MHLETSELQIRPDLVEAAFVLGGSATESLVAQSLAHLEDLLKMGLEHPARVESRIIDEFSPRSGKKGSIRRAFD
jgi:hypothetical protein